MSSADEPPTAVAGIGPTPVGVDVGERTLAAVAPATVGDLDDALTIDGTHVRRRLDRLRETVDGLQAAPFDSTAAERQVVAAEWRRLRGELYHAAAQVVRYARRSTGNPVLVLEDLPTEGGPLWAYRTADHWGEWLLPALQTAIRERAQAAGVAVLEVAPDFTSQECPRCGERGELERKRLRCTDSACPLDAVDRDRSAAVVLARRALDDTLQACKDRRPHSLQGRNWEGSGDVSNGSGT